MFGLKTSSAETSGSKPWIKVLRTSDTGLVRKENQDSILVDSLFDVYCVADGMGGGAEGAMASEIVCTTMRKAVAEVGTGFVNKMEAVALSLDSANSQINSYARNRGYRQMGSTAAVLVFDEEGSGRAAVCHVGDSRVYRVRRGLATPLTRDHSVGVELFDADRDHPLSHILTRAVGTEPGIRPDWRKVDVLPGDRFVICSDGVHDVITDTRLGFLVGYGTLEKAKERLAAEVVKNGEPDNYSFILLEIGNKK